MSDFYDVREIVFNAEDFEQLGTKEKFWFFLASGSKEKWLFKFSREGTGEHWSEKIAEQLCLRLGIPHVEYELALCDERFGVITKNVIPDFCRMVMGNEMLYVNSPSDYPEPKRCSNGFLRVKEHTVSRVLSCLDGNGVLPPREAVDLQGLSAGDVFCGYLMLDALISNQDRHHENWAVVVDDAGGQRFLCPSYDHAASLGRELRDQERIERLTTRDKNRKVESFVRKARSELFECEEDKKPMLTVDAFYVSVEKRESVKKFWLSRLEGLCNEEVYDMFRKIPHEMITDHAREFSAKMVLENKRRVLEDARA